MQPLQSLQKVVPMQFANRVKKVQSSAIRDLLRYGTDPSVISFGGGYPDPQLFPSDKLHAVYEILLTKDAPRALQYTVSDGIPELRAQIAQRMRGRRHLLHCRRRPCTSRCATGS